MNGRMGSQVDQWVFQPGSLNYKVSMQINRLNFPSLATPVLFTVAMGLMLGLMGPFGSYMNGPVSGRTVYWVLTCAIGLLLYGLPLLALFQSTVRRDARVWALVTGLLLAATVPMAFACRYIALQFWPIMPHHDFAQWYAECLLVAMPIPVLLASLCRRKHAHSAASAVRAVTDAVLPPNAICLQMEDHYVRVHTQTASQLKLMRMSDAISKMNVDGFQVHRSWWVARCSIVEAVQDGRNIRLKLSNGLEVPVSRRSVALLKAQAIIP